MQHKFYFISVLAPQAKIPPKVKFRKYTGKTIHKCSNCSEFKNLCFRSPMFWLGGGEVDVKVLINIRKIISKFSPLNYDISK
jgi:hypothetical protein